MFNFFLQEYNKEVKGFVYCLEGSSQTTKMQMPGNGKLSRKSVTYLNPFANDTLLCSHVIDCSIFCLFIVGLVQRFLVLQVNIPQSKDFSIELV